MVIKIASPVAPLLPPKESNTKFPPYSDEPANTEDEEPTVLLQRQQQIMDRTPFHSCIQVFS